MGCTTIYVDLSNLPARGVYLDIIKETRIYILPLHSVFTGDPRWGKRNFSTALTRTTDSLRERMQSGIQ